MGEDLSLIAIISAWKAEAGIEGYKSVVAIHVDGDQLYIITRHPGLFIGMKGKLAKKYEGVLSEHGYKYDVRFIDMFCGDVKQF